MSIISKDLIASDHPQFIRLHKFLSFWPNRIISPLLVPLRFLLMTWNLIQIWDFPQHIITGKLPELSLSEERKQSRATVQKEIQLVSSAN